MNEHFLAGNDAGLEPIAVIGMACRVPGAEGIDAYWQNLRDGVESIRFFSREEALAAGASPRAVDDPQHVRAAPILDGVEDFDAGLFGCTRREAEILDPQHRVFLECASAALDHAGYDPARYDGEIGVYGGVGAGEYQWYHLLQDKALVGAVGHMAIALANNTDYAATLVSYKLNLRGPSLSVSTACSTGLVAVHLACEAIRNGECGMALAGAASVELTQWHGYVYQEGSIISPDGHCRAFDADAQGTLWGSGGGVVVLKRLSDALAEGDTVHAVILGSAINNDGSDKVGFSAPSISGQSDVIRQAIGVAGVDPATVDYIEAHGTGTSVGDPIEVRALTTVFGDTREPGSCWLGTVKPNIGHLAAAAGVAGLIKTVLSLEHETIPPTLHFRRPNPAIDLPATPFRVVSEAQEWHCNGRPRRAGVSSFGMGGTNAHAVLEGAPPSPAPVPSGRSQVVPLSARTPAALETLSNRIVEQLRAHPELTLDDVAYTLQVGRRSHPYRRALVASSVGDAAEVLGGSAPRRLLVGKASGNPRTVLLFPGQGTQRVGMAGELYERFEVVRRWIDARAELLLRPTLGFDLRDVLFPNGNEAAHAEAAERLQHTGTTQPALFVVEYALTKLLETWGVRPGAMMGHSLGEYVAACVAGVFTFEEGLRIVAARGALMESMPAGAMLAVPLDEPSLELDATGLQLAAVNAPTACVVSGPLDAVDAYEQALTAEGVPVTRLRTSHAFHSRMMEPARDALVAVLAGVDLRPPTIPVISNVTGSWLTAEQATDPSYWGDHLCRPVLFGPGLQTLLADAPSVLLEVGPGDALGGLARMQLPVGTPDPVATLPPRTDSDEEALLAAAARLWTLGAPVDFAPSRAGDRRRVPLPGHPFERERYWIEGDATLAFGTTSAGDRPHGRQELDDWFWVPVWRQSPRIATASTLDSGPWLVLRNSAGSVDGLVARLREAGAAVVTVTPGAEFAADGYDVTLRPDAQSDFEQLFDRLVSTGSVPRRVVHASSLGTPATDLLDAAAARRTTALAFSSLLWLAQSMAARGLADGVHLTVVSSGGFAIIGNDVLDPVRALVTGPLRALRLEFPQLVCRHVDVDDSDEAAAAILDEIASDGPDELVAYRRGRRWLPGFEHVPVGADVGERAELRERGVYLVTGGLGGVGLSIAEHLAQRVKARLVLVGRSPLPPREEWAERAAVGGRLGRQLAALVRIEQLGGEVLTVAADVTDQEQVAAVREQALARYGEVNGILHAAGIAGGTMIEAQTPSTAADVLDPKLFGTLALAGAFRDVPLDFLALCSSVTAIAGGLGQADYCAANAFLDAFAHAADGRLPWPVLSVNWGAWLEVGMAAETQVSAGFHDAERGLRRQPVDHPLLDEAETTEATRVRVCTVTLAPDRHWVVDEHRIMGTPALPGTAYLEMVRAAFAGSDTSRPVELRDVVFLAPLGVPDGDRRTVRVVLEDAVDGGPWRVESESGGVRREHARGTVQAASPAPAPVTDLDAIRARCPKLQTGMSLQDSASGMLQFGARWSSLREVRTGHGEELARLEAGEVVRGELPSYALHPALLDEATAFGDYDGATGSYLPLGYGRVTVRRPMPARLYSHLQHRPSATSELLTCDITLLDEQGEVVTELAEFMLRRVDPAEVSDVSVPASPGGAVAEDAPSRDDGVDDEVGIRPREGGEAFVRALGARLGPQVVVSALHLLSLVDQVRRSDRDRLTEELANRVVADLPEGPLDEAYVAPSTDLERALVQLWEEAMGTTGIGVEHNFFELGGNSLVAAQLLARVRASMGVKLPMRVLFESPTISAMARRIEASVRAAS